MRHPNLKAPVHFSEIPCIRISRRNIYIWEFKQVNYSNFIVMAFLIISWHFFKVTFPILWVDETSTVEGENLDELKKKLVMSQNIEFFIIFMIKSAYLHILPFAALIIRNINRNIFFFMNFFV